MHIVLSKMLIALLSIFERITRAIHGIVICKKHSHLLKIYFDKKYIFKTKSLSTIISLFEDVTLNTKLFTRPHQWEIFYLKMGGDRRT